MRLRGFTVLCAVVATLGGLVVAYLKSPELLDRFWALPLPAEWIAGPVLVLATLGALAGAGLKVIAPGETGLDAAHRALVEKAAADSRKVLADQELSGPNFIPVNWYLVEDEFAGTAEVASGESGRAAFSPLPGFHPVPAADLRAGGGIAELFRALAGLGSGSLIIMGVAGAGKTGAGRLLMDEWLKRYSESDGARRAVPVPVWTTAESWPDQPIDDWAIDLLAGQLSRWRYPGVRRRLARSLVSRQQMGLFLDGLDEMPAERRPKLLQELRRSSVRTVLLSRPEELAEASGQRRWRGAAVVSLRELPGREAVRYLEDALPGGRPAHWAEFRTALVNDPHGPLAGAISSPLTLTLVRDVYGPDRDIGELLTLVEKGGDRDEVEAFLLSQLIEAQYEVRENRPAGPYSAAEARAVLTTLARQMQGSRDLDLWTWRRRVSWRLNTLVLAAVLVVAASLTAAAGALAAIHIGPAAGAAWGLLGGTVAMSVVYLAMGRRRLLNSASMLGELRFERTWGANYLGVGVVAVGSAYFPPAGPYLTIGSACLLIGAALLIRDGLGFVVAHVQDRTPIRMPRFLQDAVKRNILREVGLVIQFRHAKLQDYLAAEPAPSPARTP